MPPTPSTRTAVHGADADRLEWAAIQLRDAADDLDGQAGSLTALLRSVVWVGGVADRFHGDWHGAHRPRLVATAGYLRTAATELDRNAADQRAASSPRSATAGGPSPSPSPTDPRLAARLDDVLGELGLGRRGIELVVAHLERLDGDVAARMVTLLASPGVAAVVRESGHVVDVAGVVVDVLADLDDHADLPIDERVVHALADAAIRFGMQEGAEHGVELLTASVTAALLPGFGAALAPVVGQASGVIAEQLFDEAIDALDERTDAVDWCADRAVDLYRAALAGLDALADVAEAGVAIAVGAWDLTGDVADWIDDRADEVGDALLDVGRDVGREVADGIVDGLGAVGGFLTGKVPGLG